MGKRASGNKEPYKRLAEINRAITTSLNFDEVLDLIVENATHLVGARLTALLLVDEDGLLRIQAARGLHPELVRTFTSHVEEDVIGQLNKALAVAPNETLFSVPVIAKNAVKGVVVITREHPLNEEEEWQLSALADQAAIALRNARLYEMELAEATQERDRTLEALSESHEQINRILGSITDLFYSLDHEWRFIDINRQTEIRFGKTRQELIGKVFWDVYPATVNSPFYSNFHKAVEEKAPVHFELESKIVPDTWFEAHAYPDDKGLTVYLRDITERRQAEIANLMLAAIVESSDDAIIGKDLNGVIKSWNDGAQEIFGYTAAETIGNPITMLIPRDRMDEESKILEQIRAGQRIEHFQTVRRRKDGVLINVSLTISPIKSEDGEVVGVSKIARDITAAKQAEEQLKRALKFDEAVMLGMGEGLYTIDGEGLVTFMNPAAQKLLGWTLEELIGRRMHDVTHFQYPDGRPFPREECQGLTVLREGVSLTDCEDFFIRKDGTFFPVIYSSSPLRDGNRVTGLVVVFRDISERRVADHALAEKARLLDLSNDAIIVRDVNGRIVYWNQGAEETYGWLREEALGKRAHELLQTEYPEPLLEILEKLHRDNRWTGELVHVRRDGIRITTVSRWALDRDEQGRPANIFETDNDITDRKLAEVEREELLKREHEARQSAEDANRLKDEFLATLSHELRNPLNVILGYAEVLLRSDEAKQSPFVRRAAETLKRNALSQSQLVRDLLDLSRLHMGKLALNREPVALTTIINNAVETVRAESAAKEIQIDLQVPDEVMFVDADPLRMEQIVWNLLNNAVKFTPSGGTVTVGLSRNGKDAHVVVKDTGQGIEPAFLPHVFEMFRQADATISRRHGGMGIGLALVHELVQLHDGSVSVSSAGVGQGAQFTITLPLTHAERELQTSTSVVKPGALDRMKILVVDDSIDTVDMLRHLFEMDGASVKTAGSGADALEIAAQEKFDVILSDISMPGMDGFELLRRLRQIPNCKEVPVLALTGFGRVEDVERAKAEGFYSHITKPVDVAGVVEILQEIPAKARP